MEAERKSYVGQGLQIVELLRYCGLFLGPFTRTMRHIHDVELTIRQ
jgi:hypothetical protein